MSDEPKQRPQVIQARRFADSLTYNAWSALHRADQLMRDAREIEEVLKAEREGDGPMRPWFGFEVVSYYLVGLATCLEWHARTRLADLYTYRPEAIEKKTLEGKVSPDTLAQMIRADVTIPHLLSASITVGSVADYYGSLQSVFDALGIAAKVSAIVQPEIRERIGLFGTPIEQTTVFQTLEELFAARHALVHEIGVGRGPSPVVGDNWDIQEVRRTGHTVLETMRAFERTLASDGPTDFPNLLDNRYWPVDEQARLRTETADVTARIGEKIRQISTQGRFDESAAWDKVIAGQDALQAFVSNSELFGAPGRRRGQILAKLELEQRLKVLRILDDELDDPTNAKGNRK